MNSFESLRKDIKKLGVREGDTLFVRISYRAVGKTEGGPKVLIDALLSVIGPKGTIIATAFPQRIPAIRKNSKKYRNTLYVAGMKPITGVIPVIMAQYPEACFSSHPISPYVAIGYHADEITKMHTPHTESYDIVNFLIERYGCKCLRIGGNILDGTTHVAFTEGLKNSKSYQYRMAEGNYYIDIDGKRKWMEKSVSAFCYSGFEKFFQKKIYHYPGAVLAEGTIGEGIAMLTDMAKTLEVERTYISNNPRLLLCESPECSICRTSFSYSDQNIFQYTIHQLKDLLNPKTFKMAKKRIRGAVFDKLFGKKCQ